ncbi:MAG: hypothetical protein HQK77_07830, partial [Desulfobacterales bacterium]|nr:hypothetical protein [Desulfobacterales bacterium]
MLIKNDQGWLNWHRLWGLMITPLFQRLGCEVTVEVDLAFQKQILDVVVVRKRKHKKLPKLINPDYYEGFETLNEYNLISFKSFNEVFNHQALEEFYGHLTNYRKLNQIEKDGLINLYAVTHHLPDKLFKPYLNTPFLSVIKPDMIYELKLLTPVRFIITRKMNHPILGLFSNDLQQIMKSRERLEHDQWLINEVNSYLGELYKFYQLEGLNMPYTQEMFIKDHYPEWYKKIEIATITGEKIGIKKGEVRGIKKG